MIMIGQNIHFYVGHHDIICTLLLVSAPPTLNCEPGSTASLTYVLLAEGWQHHYLPRATATWLAFEFPQQGMILCLYCLDSSSFHYKTTQNMLPLLKFSSH